MSEGMSAIPKRVDVIIIGTGLSNSIVAAACSRVGKTVLHLDENSYYGNDWASFTFQQLIDWIRARYPEDKALLNVPEEFINKSRMFCLDLAPKYLYSNGHMVELLVKSNVARYHEFKNNIRILSCLGDEIHVMPCRRNEVFTSALLSNLADKRRLMKFIELCLKYEPNNSVDEQMNLPIKQYLEETGLKPTLQDFVINSIAMVKPSDPTQIACEKIKKFMIATERYGRSPFLFPLYGCGEFPQSFCRLSAVFGGLYCLNTQIKEVTVVNDPVDKPENPPIDLPEYSVKFSDENHTVVSDKIVINELEAVKLKLAVGKSTEQEYLSRAILITREATVVPNDSESSSGQDMISFLRIPPSDHNKNDVYLIELNSSVLVCPKGHCIIYLWTRQSTEPENDLKPTITRLFKDRHDGVCWQFYYQQSVNFERTEQVDESSNSKPGLYTTNPICDDIDYLSTIKEAERVFKSMYPDAEFLPRAPDPDEIINTSD